MFSRGFLDKIIEVWKPVRTASDYGGTTVQYQKDFECWANADYSHGKRAMNQGQLDVYQTLMVRCDYWDNLSIRNRLKIEGRYYVIDSFNADKHENETQITCFEVEDINKVRQTP